MNTTLQSLWIITYDGCPNGMAGTHRILAHANGLQKLGVCVQVHVVGPSDLPSNPINGSQVLPGGVEILYPYGTVRKNGKIANFINKSICSFRYVWRLAWAKEPPQVVFFYGWQIFFPYLLKIVCSWRKIVLISERNEAPELHTAGPATFLAALSRQWKFSPFSGMILMTNLIIQWYQKHGWPQERFIHLPMSVEFSRFVDVKIPDEVPDKYFLFTGGLVWDYGLKELLEAFEQVAIKHPAWALVIIGSGRDGLKISEWLKAHALNDKVLLKGLVKREEIPAFICASQACIMVRPKSLKADSGFPTKLGEYLAAGKAAVVSNIGEISHYLTDAESVYFVQPGSVEELTEAMSQVIEAPQRARTIGENGKKIAAAYFNSETQATQLKQWIEWTFLNR